MRKTKISFISRATAKGEEKDKSFSTITLFIFLIFFLPLIFSPQLVKAEDEETTFPIEEAGIAAYVKLNSVNITHLTSALTSFHSRSAKRSGETYVIGTVEVPNKNGNNFPHLYLGLDGWIVAYYLKEEETSKIMQWNDYKPGAIHTTTLKDAIDIISAKIGVTYSGPVKYYHFQFPDANKITIIVDTLRPNSCFNNFSFVVPGKLLEASYSVYVGGGWKDTLTRVRLEVGDNMVFERPVWPSLSLHPYGYYEIPLHLRSNVPHFITFFQRRPHVQIPCTETGLAIVLIYKN